MFMIDYWLTPVFNFIIFEFQYEHKVLCNLNILNTFRKIHIHVHAYIRTYIRAYISTCLYSIEHFLRAAHIHSKRLMWRESEEETAPKPTSVDWLLSVNSLCTKYLNFITRPKVAHCAYQYY